jgi:hypothetical protein
VAHLPERDPPRAVHEARHGLAGRHADDHARDHPEREVALEDVEALREGHSRSREAPGFPSVEWN